MDWNGGGMGVLDRHPPEKEDWERKMTTKERGKGGRDPKKVAFVYLC